MLNTICSSEITILELILCTGTSIVFGVICALLFMYKNERYSKNFVITLALMPAIVQVVIMLVNGNIGAGIAVMGAFNLVRFRSIPGNAKEISSIFLAMAMGLATGMGYLGFGFILLICIGTMNLLLNHVKIGTDMKSHKLLRITIPESLDYTDLFDDIFKKNLKNSDLIKVKTTNLGSLFELTYDIEFKDDVNEKKFIDEIRCRNGNLNILCSRVPMNEQQI